ncbi:ABC transporter substrate-binding protein [Bosea sp. (in: a-proteobacteria)]|jgi:putative spermidine/putrescine transport system substrate-binding protein|uniref:ABC transporter substrate-binding protein n=1 Tax=Bosea sp. (in: a-proteobacteria) TaxID=1871050 RepID=UPI003F712FC1
MSEFESKSNLLRPTRRKLLTTLGGGAALSVAAPFVLRNGRAEAQSKNLVFVTWGGTYRSSVEEGLIKPFMAETGIKVTVIDTPDLAKVKAQVTTGNVEWDVFDAPGALGTGGAREGYWEPLPASLFDASDLSIPATKDLVPFYTFAGGIAYDPKRHPEGKYPKNFAEYFDAKAFPGRRTFRNRPSETLEAALLADGVPPSQLYPLDVERAFKALDRIKSSVAKWVDSTPQTITLLQTNEVDFSYSYASRVKTTGATGAGMAFSFAQTLNGLEYLAVLKNAPNKENALKFVSYALQPKAQAAVMELLGNTPVSKKALPMLSSETRKWLPNMESDQNLVMNEQWWSENFEKLSRRFKEWVLT